MRRFSDFIAAACIASCCGPVSATDLAKIDRKITKEPVYRSKPKYCLLVFGQEAKTQVWLVWDGDLDAGVIFMLIKNSAFDFVFLSLLTSICHAARAMQLLSQAKSAGFFDQPGNHNYLSEDPDLASLRAREDFKAFVAWLRAK